MNLIITKWLLVYVCEYKLVIEEQFGNPNYFPLNWAERSVQVQCKMLAEHLHGIFDVTW